MPSANDGLKQVTSDGSLADTAAAVAYAEGKNQDGWEVIVGVPGGSYVWDGNLHMANHYVMTLKGASPTNRPQITINGYFNQYCGTGKTKTLRDIIFVGGGNSSALIYVNGIGENCFHHTNLSFVNMGSTALCWIAGPYNGVVGEGPYGLVDHCSFVSDGPPTKGYYVRQNEFTPDRFWGLRDPGGALPESNNSGFTFGTGKAVYFEDNVASSAFIGAGGLLGGNSSGKVVVRNNLIHNNYIGFHGPDSSGPRQSMMQVEVYRNVFTANAGWYSPMFIRGGTGYFFENNIGDAFGCVASLEMHCTGGQYAAEGCRDCYGNLLTAPLTYPQHYPQCQQVGHPDIPKPRVWNNTIRASAPLVFNGAAPGWLEDPRNYQASVNSTAAPVGYTEYQYPHPMNTGGSPQAPSNASVPQVSGAASQGQTLTGTAGFWTWEPIGDFDYQWQRANEDLTGVANIPGATGTTYVLTPADVGKKLRFAVTATNDHGVSTAYSPYSGVVEAPGAENRISNPGFELWSGAVNGNNELNAHWTGWIDNSHVATFVETSTNDVHSGSAAYRFRHSNGIAEIFQVFVPAAPGEVMTVSFWSKVITPDGATNRGVEFNIFDNTTGVAILSMGPIEVPGLPAWTKYETTWTVPTGCTSAFIQFNSSQTWQLDHMLIDDVVVAPPATPPEEPPEEITYIRTFFSL